METSTGPAAGSASRTKVYIIICIALTIVAGLGIGLGVYYGTMKKDEPAEFQGTSVVTTEVQEGNQTIVVTQIIEGTFSWWDSNGGWRYALNGADVVAYFSLDASADAVQGNDAYTTTVYGITWRFQSQANKDLFDADTAKYVPAYGAHCAQAMASNYIASGDPNAWTVYNGVLYINLSKGVRSGWLRNIDSNIARANPNWEGRGFDNPR